AQQIQGFFDIPVDHLYASPVFFDELKSKDVSNLTIFSPDVGGMKMANAYSEVLGCPLGFVAK
ncbi:MAG TPA: ribose-phosphate diphosphokinase, partial [Opitutae bacterium]|nr:ribose-phosphate diphosphokinase [Opitutae bacterium]